MEKCMNSQMIFTGISCFLQQLPCAGFNLYCLWKHISYKNFIALDIRTFWLQPSNKTLISLGDMIPLSLYFQNIAIFIVIMEQKMRIVSLDYRICIKWKSDFHSKFQTQAPHVCCVYTNKMFSPASFLKLVCLCRSLSKDASNTKIIFMLGDWTFYKQICCRLKLISYIVY